MSLRRRSPRTRMVEVPLLRWNDGWWDHRGKDRDGCSGRQVDGDGDPGEKVDSGAVAKVLDEGCSRLDEPTVGC